MANYLHEHFTGERALFKCEDAYIDDCLFNDGESPLKESKRLEIVHTTFDWKYPLWYDETVHAIDCTFTPNARAGIWYTKGATFRNCVFDAPKLFRKCVGISLEDVQFSDALETLWWNKGVHIQDASVVNGDYFCQGCEDVDIDHLDLQGKYAFDGCTNVTVRNSVLRTKDVFWNCKHVVVENSFIDTEYFGWNSEDVTLIHCEIHSHQGFCYMKGIKLIDCRVVDSDLTFEYCTDIDAEIVTRVESIKNPISGVIRVAEVGEIIQDDPAIDTSKVQIIVGHE